MLSLPQQKRYNPRKMLHTAPHTIQRALNIRGPTIQRVVKDWSRPLALGLEDGPHSGKGEWTYDYSMRLTADKFGDQSHLLIARVPLLRPQRHSCIAP